MTALLFCFAEYQSGFTFVYNGGAPCPSQNRSTLAAVTAACSQGFPASSTCQEDPDAACVHHIVYKTPLACNRERLTSWAGPASLSGGELLGLLLLQLNV